MELFSIEHRPAAQRADFIVYGLIAGGLALYLLVTAPASATFGLLGAAVLGWLGWSGMEYGLHRFVLHHLPPFSRWHADHHARPTALLGTPTVLSVLLFVVLIFLPAWVVAGLSLACAFTLGVLLGYLGYAATHHAVHHSRSHSAWLMDRKRWHAQHHGRPGLAVCYGVTTAWWDERCGTQPKLKPTLTPAPRSSRWRSTRRSNP